MLIRFYAAGCVLVAVLMQHRLPMQRRWLVADLLEVLGKVIGLLREPPRVLVIRPHLQELVLEDGDAAGFRADDRRAGPNLVSQRVEYTHEVARRQGEHSIVVERAAAAEMSRRDDDVATCVFERLDGSNTDVSLEVIRERVGPQNHLLAGRVVRPTPLVP